MRVENNTAVGTYDWYQTAGQWHSDWIIYQD